MSYRLTVCIPSLRTRWPRLEQTLADLIPQMRGDVQLILDVDDGGVTVGAKRQRMLEMAKGDFVVFHDDDDPVHPDYVKLILGAIKENPAATFIGFKLTRQVNDGGEVPWQVPLPFHITPVRRDLALRAGFPDKPYGEDNDYAQKLREMGADSGGVFIDRIIYRYHFRSDRSGEKAFAAFDALSRCPA